MFYRKKEREKEREIKREREKENKRRKRERERERERKRESKAGGTVQPYNRTTAVLSLPIPRPVKTQKHSAKTQKVEGIP